MSYREIGHRIREQLNKVLLTWRPKAKVAPKLEGSSLNVSQILKFCEEMEVHDIATRVMSAVRIYGVLWSRDIHGNLEWFKFPSGRTTECVKAFRIKYRERKSFDDDIRVSWELNRLTWLIPVAAAANRGNQHAVDFVVREVASFLDSDKPGKSLRWNSIVELALQSIALLIIDAFMPDVEDWISLRDKIAWAIAHRRRWILKMPSKFSSANNHRLAELAALAAIGERTCDTRNLKVLADELDSELGLQFLGDGFSAELSFDYHCFAFDLLVSLAYLAPEFAKGMNLANRLLPISRITQQISKFFAGWPSAGDSDQARVLSTLVPAEAAPMFLARLCSDEVPSETSRFLTLPDAGYSFVQTNAVQGQARLLIDHGAIGYGRIAAHAHSDVLAIWLKIDEIDTLIEAGSYCFHAEPNMRNLLRDSSMHNTVTIDGRSLSSPIGPFLWNPELCATGTLDKMVVTDSGVEVEIRAVRKGVPLVSRTLKLKEGALAVRDEILVGSVISSHFLFHPEFSLVTEPNQSRVTARHESGVTVTIMFTEKVSVEIDQVPVSMSYGSLQSANRLTFTSSKSQEVVLEWNSVLQDE